MTDEERKIARICCGNLHPKRMCDDAIECHYTEVARQIIGVIDQARKDTAKEILQTIKCCQTISNMRGKRYNRYELDQKDFENIADRYGVEMDNE